MTSSHFTVVSYMMQTKNTLLQSQTLQKHGTVKLKNLNNSDAINKNHKARLTTKIILSCTVVFILQNF